MNDRLRESGSVPLAMLAAIIVGGVVLASLNLVRTGQQTARFDRDFNKTVGVADAGIQQAYAYLADLSETERDTIRNAAGETTFTAAGIGTYTWGPSTVTFEPQQIGDGEFAWTAELVGANYWQVKSVGEVGEVDRTLEAEIGERTLFPLAAFADISIRLRGANSATSYTPTNSDTGAGDVGSNGSITLNGNATVDWVRRYNSANYNGGGNVDGVWLATEELVLPNLGAAAFEEGGPCEGGATGAYTGGPLVRGETYCFTSVDFPAGVTELTDGDGHAVTIYISAGGSLALNGQGSNGAKVNMQGSTAPDSTRLLIYLAGGTVTMNNHTEIAAGIYAPTSACSEGTSNAAADIYGSIVCSTLDNQGGWDFHYDDRLSNLTDQIFSIVGYREEVGGTTSHG